MKKIYLAAVAGNLGMLSVGLFLGWASPTLPLLIDGDANYPVRLNSEEASWVASLFLLSAVPGTFMSAFMVNVFGRKNTMLFTVVPSIISWLLIVFATSPWELYISRFLSGLAMGIAYVVTPMYLGEISPADIRGNLGSMLTVAAKIGITIEYIIGPFLSVKNLALISLTAPCLFLITFIWLPESPYHLMRCDAKQKTISSLVQLRGKEDVYEEADSIEPSVKTDLANEAGFRELLFIPGNRRAISSLVQLRGKEDVYEEADSIEQSVRTDLANETGFRELLFISGNRRALITLTCLGLTQQFSGIQPVLQYAQMIFHQTNANLEGKYLAMILAVMQLICSIVCMMVTDCSGRKILLIISAIGSAFSTGMVAVYFHLQYYQVDTSNITWLAATGVILYIIMFGLGLAALPYTMAGELFATNVKPLANMIGMNIINIASFIVTQSYLVISESAGTHTPFWIFTACSLAGTLFTVFYVPETKGKTLQQIQEELHGSKQREVEHETFPHVNLSSTNI